MANKTGKDITFKLDGAASTLVALTSHLNSASVSSAHSTLEDTALGDDESTFLMGVAGATVSINGFWNSTTRGVFAPLMGNRTSITKTFEFYDGVAYLNGEAWVNNIQVSGSVNSVETFSADLTVTGALNNTTKALA